MGVRTTSPPTTNPSSSPSHTSENLRAIGCTLEIALSLRVRKEKPIKLSKIFNFLFLITQAMHGYVQVVKNSHNTCKIKVFPKQRILSSSGSHLSDHSSAVDQFWKCGWTRRGVKEAQSPCDTGKNGGAAVTCKTEWGVSSWTSSCDPCPIWLPEGASQRWLTPSWA